jgi:hypothetical protein
MDVDTNQDSTAEVMKAILILMVHSWDCVWFHVCIGVPTGNDSLMVEGGILQFVCELFCLW